MALMKFAFFFLTLSALFEAYHARYLHDAVDRRSSSKEVIEMVTGEEYKFTAYGRVAKAPPPPKVAAPSKGQDTYGGDNPKAPQSPSITPPQVRTNCVGYNFKGPNDAPSKGETTYGQDNPKREPSTPITPPQVQTNYTTYNLNGANDAPSQGETTYGQHNPKNEPSTSTTPLQLQINCATEYLKKLTDAPSQGETTYGEYNPKKEPSTSNDAPSQGEATYRGDNPRQPLSSIAPGRGQITSPYYFKSYVMRVLNFWG